MSTVSDPASPLASLPRAEQRRLLLIAAGRIGVMTLLLLTAFFLLPIGQRLGSWGLVALIASIAAFVVAIVFQVRKIIDARIPHLRAIETVATAVPVFIVMFSTIYVVMADQSPHSFSEPMTRMGALYFTISVLSTVGFGDISAATDVARAVVSIQMVADLVLLGILLRVIVQASRLGTARRQAEVAGSSDRPDPPS